MGVADPDRASDQRLKQPIAIIPPALALLGITPALPGSRESLIQAEEVAAVQSLYDDLYSMGQNTEEQWTMASQEGRKTLFFAPLSAAEMDAKINAEVDGQIYPEKEPIPLEQMVADQKARADGWYSQLSRDMVLMSDAELVELRVKLTLQLAAIYTQEEYNDGVAGLPAEIFVIARSGAFEAREAANRELRRRGLTE